VRLSPEYLTWLVLLYWGAAVARKVFINWVGKRCILIEVVGLNVYVLVYIYVLIVVIRLIFPHGVLRHNGKLRRRREGVVDGKRIDGRCVNE
jgi:hypothetical protein